MPMDRSKYPDNWEEISQSIIERANGGKDPDNPRAGAKCEFCGVENYSIGLRDKDGTFYSWETLNDDFRLYESLDIPAESKGIKIVLTVAHLDHDTANNDPENLKALCQKCHNNHDVTFRKANRRRSKAEANGQLMIPGVF